MTHRHEFGSGLWTRPERFCAKSVQGAEGSILRSTQCYSSIESASRPGKSPKLTTDKVTLLVLQGAEFLPDFIQKVSDVLTESRGDERNANGLHGAE